MYDLIGVAFTAQTNYIAYGALLSFILQDKRWTNLLARKKVRKSFLIALLLLLDLVAATCCVMENSNTALLDHQRLKQCTQYTWKLAIKTGKA